MYSEVKQVFLTEKYICLTILSFNPVYKFSEMYLSYSLDFTTNKYSYSKVVILGFQYEPISLDVKEVCFQQERDIPSTHEKSRKNQSVTKWCRCIMHTDVEYLSCGEALG